MIHFSRPDSIPYPNIWTKFYAKDLHADTIVEYRVQDLPQEYFHTAIELLKSHFLSGEFLKRHLHVISDTISVDEIVRAWQKVLDQQISLACFHGTDLIGVNLVYVDDGWDQPKSVSYFYAYDKLRHTIFSHKKFHGAKQQLMYNANMYLDNKFDYKARYGVDKRLNAIALCVDSAYRGRGIGVRILESRVPLCKALGIKLTANNFSCIVAQRTAEKARFKTEEVAT